jgi:hypothetical protein
MTKTDRPGDGQWEARENVMSQPQSLNGADQLVGEEKQEDRAHQLRRDVDLL